MRGIHIKLVVLTVQSTSFALARSQETGFKQTWAVFFSICIRNLEEYMSMAMIMWWVIAGQRCLQSSHCICSIIKPDKNSHFDLLYCSLRFSGLYSANWSDFWGKCLLIEFLTYLHCPLYYMDRTIKERQWLWKGPCLGTRTRVTWNVAVLCWSTAHKAMAPTSTMYVLIILLKYHYCNLLQ